VSPASTEIVLANSVDAGDTDTTANGDTGRQQQERSDKNEHEVRCRDSVRRVDGVAGIVVRAVVRVVRVCPGR